MFMKNFLSGKNCLTLVTIKRIQSFLMRLIKIIGKMKDEFGGVIVEELVGLKQKMCSINKLMVKNVIRQKE